MYVICDGKISRILLSMEKQDDPSVVSGRPVLRTNPVDVLLKQIDQPQSNELDESSEADVKAD